MRKAIVLVAAVACAIGVCQGQAISPHDSLVAREAALSNSFNTGDSAAIDDLLADDFVGVSIYGSHYDKAVMKRAVADFAHQGGKYLTDRVSIRIYGDAAVAQGYDHVTHADGTPGPGTAWTDTWILQHGEWKLVASEDAPMPR
jgi:Domain of unknown function (DUF4440)